MLLDKRLDRLSLAGDNKIDKMFGSCSLLHPGVPTLRTQQRTGFLANEVNPNTFLP
jgi:hypothetical protein